MIKKLICLIVYWKIPVLKPVIHRYHAEETRIKYGLTQVIYKNGP